MTTGDAPITQSGISPLVSLVGRDAQLSQVGHLCFGLLPLLPNVHSEPAPHPFIPGHQRSFHIGCSKVANPAADELLHFLHYPADIASTVALCKKLQLFLRLGKRLSVHTDIGTANRQLRKVTKAKSVFPTDDSLLKMLYLAMMDITKKWTGRRQDWSVIHTQLAVFFADRMLD